MKNINKHKKNIARVRNCPVWCECSSNLTFSTATKNPAQLLVKMMHHPQQKLQPVPGLKTAAIYLKIAPTKTRPSGICKKTKNMLSVVHYLDQPVGKKVRFVQFSNCQIVSQYTSVQVPCCLSVQPNPERKSSSLNFIKSLYESNFKEQLW